MIVPSGPTTSRVASLLPFRHMALIPFERLYPTMESWLREQREANTLADFLREHANVAMISGPSKSADIEMNLTLGVHGPNLSMPFWAQPDLMWLTASNQFDACYAKPA